jgi:hypothetical protein
MAEVRAARAVPGRLAMGSLFWAGGALSLPGRTRLQPSEPEPSQAHADGVATVLHLLNNEDGSKE